ncbi:MAG TPA: M56 family metallopeptidase [Mucilaginibacter sp.]|nr:M56 family metallopeptidase [Mucilaginibacter sp.]
MLHTLMITDTLNKIVVAFCWTLIHSLWQGLALAVIAAVVLTAKRKADAARRYNLALIFLILFIAGAGATFCYEWVNASSEAALVRLPGNIGIKAVPEYFDINHLRHTMNVIAVYFSANAPLITMIWGIVFMFKSVKMISCVVYNQRIRNYQVHDPAEIWTDKTKAFADKLGITKTVRLLQSGYIKVPVVVGHLKPVILFPAGLMTGLPADQVEAILLHELAHIRRNDYIINFLQNIAESVFFFNPGLLWISAVMKEERENCCDDIALAQTNNKISFVQALVSFKEYSLYQEGYATAFPGKKNYLMQRALRILNNKRNTPGTSEKLFFGFSILTLLILVTTVAVAQIREYHPALKKSDTIEKKADRLNADKTNERNTSKRINNVDSIGMMTDIVNIKKQKAHVARKLASADKRQNGNAAKKLPSDTSDRIAAVPTNIVSTKPVKPQSPADLKNATQNWMQAERDRLQADIDRARAQKDREQADKDRQQAELDRVQADKDRQQAELNRQQAEKDRVQAEKDRAQAELSRRQSAKSKTSVQE